MKGSCQSLSRVLGTQSTSCWRCSNAEKLYSLLAAVAQRDMYTVQSRSVSVSVRDREQHDDGSIASFARGSDTCAPLLF